MTKGEYMEANNKFSIEEVAKQLKVSDRTLLREIKRGNLKAEKAGRRYLIPHANLEQYLKRETQELDLDKKIEEYLISKKAEMVTLLQRLVALNSDSNDLGQEGRAAHFIKTFLEKHDIRCVVYEEGKAVAVRASYGYANDGILLDCPLDTTPAGDFGKWTYPPFEGVIKDKKMFGRGTADAKAGIVCQIYTLLALKEFVPEEKIRVEMVFDGGEQNGEYLGMELAVKKGLPVTAGIIGYSGYNGELQIGARGYHRYTLTSHGKSSHTGSKNHYGINAVENLCDVISEMHKQELPSSKIPLFPFGSRMTFSMIEGGYAINIVPDTAMARVDVRVTPDIKREWVTNFLKNHLYRIQKSDPKVSIDIQYDLGREGYMLNANEKIVTTLQSVVKDVIKKTPKPVAAGPAHIGNLLYEHNIPVLIWGPRGGNVHSYDEYVELDSLPETSVIYANTILKYFE